MKIKNILFLTLLVLLFAGCGSNNLPLKTVDNVDIIKYSGTWYEIARYEHYFEKGCKNVSATYELMNNGDIGVINRCVDLKSNISKEAKGIAYAVDSTNSKLKVSFFRPFYGDYWIIDLDDEYKYSLVGSPTHQYLWILSRTKTIDSSSRNRLVQKLAHVGFNADKLVWTVQE
jgi:apolipoprotein D and lipocalin family protein